MRCCSLWQYTESLHSLASGSMADSHRIQNVLLLDAWMSRCRTHFWFLLPYQRAAGASVWGPLEDIPKVRQAGGNVCALVLWPCS